METGFPQGSCAPTAYRQDRVGPIESVWRRADEIQKHHQFAASGAGASVTAGGAGASCTGAAGRDDFGVGCFLAEAGAAAVAAAGRGDADDPFAPGDAAGLRGGGVVPVLGSGLMMLIGGVEAAEGNSALVGLPVGIDDGRAATAAGKAAGAFQVGA